MRKRNNLVSIRFTPEEYKHFVAAWQKSGLSQAQFILSLIDKNEDKKETTNSADETFVPPKEF